MRDSLVKLIRRSEPRELEKLQDAHPNAADLLSTPQTRRVAAQAPTPEDLTAARLDLLLKGIGPLRKELDEIKRYVTDKMKTVQRIKFVGAIFATLAGLIMAITAALTMHEAWEKVVSAAFATIGGLVVIFSDHVQSAPSGRRLASVEEFGKLNQIAGELYRLEARAERHHAFPLTDDDLKQMISEMDSYAAHINQLQVK